MMGVAEFCSVAEAAVMADAKEARIAGVLGPSKPLINTAILRELIAVIAAVQ